METKTRSSMNVASKTAGAPASSACRVASTRHGSSWGRSISTPPGNSPSCQGADLDPLIEPILQHHVHLELGRLRLVHLEPEQLVALPSGDEAGLGEVGGHGIKCRMGE